MKASGEAGNDRSIGVKIRESFLVRTSLARPVSVLMIFLATLVVGYIAYTRIPLQLLPSGLSPPNLSIRVNYFNSSPREVEEKISKPIEEALGTIPGISEVTSISTAYGSRVRVEFSSSTDMDQAYADIEERLDRIKGSFPDGVDRYWIFRFNFDTDMPIHFMGIFYDPEVKNPSAIIENIIVKKLERIDGVARVGVDGLIDENVEIELDENQVRAHRISIYDLVTKLGADNFALAGGTVREGGKKYYIRSLAKFKSIEEIRNYPVRPNLRLGDIAQVGLKKRIREFLARINKKEAAVCIINKDAISNTVAVCNNIERAIEEDLMKDPRLEGFSFKPFWDQGTEITRSLSTLKDTALWGAGLAIIVLFSFLWHIRMTLIITLAIPLSLLIALIVIFFQGKSMNVLSMMGLTLGIGMLVDNSVVVVENIFRRRQEGDGARRAAIFGASEISLAIITSTLTTIAVFLPLIFMGDEAMMRTIMGELGFPVCFSLVASLFVALVFIPLGSFYLHGRKSQVPLNRAPSLVKRISDTLSTFQSSVINRISNLYLWLLNTSLSHRLGTILVIILFLCSTPLAFSIVGKTSQVGEERHFLSVDFDLPPNISLLEANEMFIKIEDFVLEQKELLGYEDMAVYFSKKSGSANMYLGDDSPLTSNEMQKRIKEPLEEFVQKNLPGVTHNISRDEERANEGSLRIHLRGRDSEMLSELSKEVEQRLRDLPEITGISSPLDEGGENEVRISLNRELTQKYGVDPNVILGTISYSLRGYDLPDFESEDREIPMRIHFKDEDREHLSQLKVISLFTSSGKEIPLNTIAGFTLEKGYSYIYRENSITSTTLTLTTEAEDMSALSQKIQARLAGIEMPRGYEWSETGGMAGFQEGFSEILPAFILSIVLVFLLMGILFESFILPFSVIFSIPFAIFGALWTLIATGTSLDNVGLVGFVVLVGVVVNNAIVLIDCANRQRWAGMDRRKALLTAGQFRFRPILMTAFTTIVGLLPMALSPRSSGGISYRVLARVVAGGLLTSTLFTLIIVPLFYTLLDDLGNTLKRYLFLKVKNPLAGKKWTRIVRRRTQGE